MPTIRTVNLLWEKRIRQTYPVARYALDDEGTLALAVPRPLEARTYDRTLLATNGEALVQGGFAVETLLKLEMTPHAADCLGMTSDDLYLFENSAKSRFLGDRRLLFVDAALNETGHNLFTAFSDIAGASYALAYGDMSGRVIWTAELEGIVTTVAISRQGNRVAIGSEGGLVFLKDASRRDVWEFGTGESVRALACSRDGVFVAYGTSEGAVGLIDGDGTRKWEAALPGEVINLALSGDGVICAALCRPRQNPNNVRLACIGPTGQIDWEYDSEQNLLGLSLSSSGTFLATGSRNGTVAVYAVVIGEGTAFGGPRPTGGAQLQAERLAQAGDWRGAWRVLEIALDADPANLELYDTALSQRAAYLENALGAIQAQQEDGDYAGAVAALETLLRDAPLSTEVVSALAEVRRLRAEQLHDQVRAFLRAEQDDQAEETLRLALSVVPFHSRELRQELAALRERRSHSADALADELLTAGKLEEAVSALERAQNANPTSERGQKLLRVQTAMEFAAGMTAYNAKEYREAVFQFKKVLARDPAHSEAKRYLGFSQKFAQDTANETLNDRFSRLE
jgi:tetratricopeptide (TPR) repeat protein